MNSQSYKRPVAVSFEARRDSPAQDFTGSKKKEGYERYKDREVRIHL